MKKFTVIRDTKEHKQKGWEFDISDDDWDFNNNDPLNEYSYKTIGQSLKTGDYTIVGFEKILCIERKGSAAEWYSNVLQNRFIKELERMQSYKYRFIVCEFDVSDILNFYFSPLAKKIGIKMNGKFVLKKTIELMIKYNVNILFCGNKGKDVVLSIFKRVIENESISSKNKRSN